jgi:outer membrane protein TolC
VDVQVSEAKSELLNAEDNIHLELGKLAETLGRDDVAAVEGELPVLEPKLIEGAKVSEIQERADILAAHESDEGSRLREYAARSHWAPHIAAFWNYQSYNNRNDQYDDWNNFRDAYAVGINLQWNLFDGFASTARAHEATEQRYQAEKETQLKVLKAKQDFDLWKRKFNYYYAVYKARQDEVVKAKESLRLAKEGRRVGARTNTDLLDAETDHYKAQAGSVTAQLGAVEALLNLELATGHRFMTQN